MPAFVFDLGGTHLRSGWTPASDASIEGFSKQRVSTFLDGLDARQICADICGRIERFIAAHPAAPPDAPIVFAFPGPIANRRLTLSAPTLYGSPTGDALPDIAGELTARTGREVHILNDVSAAAWGISAETTATRFLVITVSSGIGSKLFDRGNPMGVIDDPPFAGEIGHHVVDPSPEAIRCDCGGPGHLGGIASGRGVERLARRVRNNNSLTNEHDVVPAILQGEPWALDVLRAATEPLARTILAVTMAMGLDRIFIIGGFAQSLGATYGTILRELLAANSQYAIFGEHLEQLIELVPPADELCLQGAAFYSTTLNGARQAR